MPIGPLGLNLAVWIDVAGDETPPVIPTKLISDRANVQIVDRAGSSLSLR